MYKGGKMSSEWAIIWQELRCNLSKQPVCPQHTDYPHIRTLAQKVINDVLSVSEQGIVVRSHRTRHNDFIEEERLKVWWEHLTTVGSASLKPGSENNPHPWRSRIVGAIIATCLSSRIRILDHNTIEYIG
jgi:hypothetical protein